MSGFFQEIANHPLGFVGILIGGVAVIELVALIVLAIQWAT